LCVLLLQEGTEVKLGFEVELKAGRLKHSGRALLLCGLCFLLVTRDKVEVEVEERSAPLFGERSGTTLSELELH
jgi:hypothetical protein